VKKLSKQLKDLRNNTDRRFAILMTGLQDFMAAYQQERNESNALLNIQEKATKVPPATPKEEKKKRNKKPAK